MNSPNSQRSHLGLSSVEVIVLLAAGGVLLFLAFPSSRGGLEKAQLTKIVSHAKQIHLATMNAAVDAGSFADRKEAPASWPADCVPSAVSAGSFVQRLADGGYLMARDLKVFGVGTDSRQSYYQGTGPFDAEVHCGFKIYNVAEKDGAETIFLTTKNVEIDAATDSLSFVREKKAFPGKKGFVVFRKGGDGTVYTKFDGLASRCGSLPSSLVKILPSGGTFTPSAAPRR